MKTFTMGQNTVDFEIECNDGSLLQFELQYPVGEEMKKYREREVSLPGAEAIVKNMADITGQTEEFLLKNIKWHVVSNAYSYFFGEVTKRCSEIPPGDAGK